jgi:flagellar motor switch protein FliM
VVSKEELSFFNKWAELAPAELIPEDLPSQLFAQIEPYIHGSISWQWTQLQQMLTFVQLHQICIQPTLLLQIAILPLEHRIFVECPANIARVMLDRSLGGSGENIEEGIPFSEIERGIFTYLLLKVGRQLQQIWASHLRLELRLEAIHHSLEPLQEIIPHNEAFFCRELQIQFLNHSGFIRLFTPVKIINEFARSLSDLRYTAQEYDLFRQRIHRIADTPLTGFLRVGIVDLSESDLIGLQTDDIILIRECLAHRREEDRLWDGEGILQFSERPNYALRCSLQNDASNPMMQIRIEEVIEISEPPMIGQMDRSEYLIANQHSISPSEYEQGVDMKENFDEMGPVLSDVPVPLIVELGRINCHARDIMYMRVGQILELNRSPHEPLELVVNSQSVGRGELVEVEGKLGIRIISLRR